MSPPATPLQKLRAVATKVNTALLRALERATPSEQNRLFGLTLGVGGACGLAAVAFHGAIDFADKHLLQRGLGLHGYWRIVALVVIPAVGALIAGILLDKVAPNARGSGIPQVKWTYTARSGRLRLRDGVAKFFIGALQIGTGSSLGREGPTVQICASVASGLGRIFALSPSNQRRLIPVGAAAGIAAAFNAPIAAVTFVIEELVGSLDTTVLSGVVVAAALAAVVEHSISGEHPVLDVPGEYGLVHPSSLLVFATLGLVAGVLGHLFSRALLGLRKRFATKSLVARWAQPGVGGLATGAVAAAVLKLFGSLGIAGGGYDVLADALHGNIALKVLAVLCAAKFAATIFSYSSGGAGGIFAPCLFIGGMLGGLFGWLDHYGLGHGDAASGAFALVGMGAFFAAVVRAPITSILIIFEMTNNYRLVLPLMVSNAIAYWIARRFGPTPIYDALLEQDGLVAPQSRKSAPALAGLRVADAMVSDVVALDATMTVGEAMEKVSALEFSSYPIVDERHVLKGVLTEARLRRLLADGATSDTLGDHARLREYLRDGQNLRDALSAMNRLGVRQLAVIDDAEERHLVGILAMTDVVRVLLKAEERADEVPPSRIPPPVSSRPGT